MHGVTVFIACLFALSGCASPAPPRPADYAAPRADPAPTPGPIAHTFVVAADTQGAPMGDRWAVLLPGASGLTVFEDDGHYFRAARALAEQGLNCLIVDYKAVYRDRGSPRMPTTASKIALATRLALDAATADGLIDAGDHLVLLGWSLGGEGVWEVMRHPELVQRWSIAGAVVYYPASDDGLPATCPFPTLVLAGGLDDVTPPASVVAWGESARARGEPAEVVVLNGARHGFDIESLPERRVVELIPVIGPRATFGSNAEAAREAWRRVEAFLNSLEWGSLP